MILVISTDRVALNVNKAVIYIRNNRDSHSNVNNAKMQCHIVMNAVLRICAQNAPLDTR